MEPKVFHSHVTRKLVVETARSYENTPFHHLGRVKGTGVDCVGLVLCVAEDLGLKDVHGVPLLRNDYTDYSPQPLGDFVMHECKYRLIEKSIGSMLPGDVITMKVPYSACHAGFVVERHGALYVIHALNSSTVPRVMEHILDKKWHHAITGAFSLPGVI
jgi:hypothetical protein